MRRAPFPAAATALLLLALVTVFYPSLFLGHVLSPLDTLFEVPPWRGLHPTVGAANPSLEPVAVRTLPAVLELRRDGLDRAVWDPSRAGGGPGLLRWQLGLLWPFGLPGNLLLDEPFLVNGMALARLAVAFAGSFLLLRRIGVADLAAAAGAAGYALSGPLVTRWAEPAGAALATLPLLLATVVHPRGAAEPWRRLPVAAAAWLAFLASGDAAVVVVGSGVTLAVAVATRPPRLSRLLPQAVAAALAAAVLAPSFLLSAAVPAPARPSAPPSLGAETFRLLVDPFAWGSPRADTYQPPQGFEGFPYQDACLAVGWVVLALAAVGAAAGGRTGLRWLAAAAAALAAIGLPPVGRLLATLPGVDPAALPELAGFAALAIAGLAAIGLDRLLGLRHSRRWRAAGGLVAVSVVLQGGFLAGHLWAHLPESRARLRATPAVERVVSRLDPLEGWRVVALLDALPPDTPAAFGLEDLRSAAPVHPDYRALLGAVDPQSTSGASLRVNPATADLRHPLLDLLGTRFLLEPPGLRLVEFELGQDTLEVEPRNRLAGPLGPDTLVQELVLPPGCSRLALHATSGGREVTGSVEVRLVPLAPDADPSAWTLDAARLAVDGLAWLDLPGSERRPVAARLEVRGETRGRLWLRATGDPRALEGVLRLAGRALDVDLAPSFDTSGYAVLSDGADLRVWVNHHAQLRAFAVRRAIPGDLETLLAASPPIDTSTVVVLAPEVAASLPPMPEGGLAPGEVLAAVDAGPARLVLDATLAHPAVLVTSIPSSPLWRARVDGRPATPVTANGYFLALPLGPGDHRVELEAALPTLWYVGSGAGVVGLLAAAVLGRRRPTA